LGGRGAARERVCVGRDHEVRRELGDEAALFVGGDEDAPRARQLPQARCEAAEVVEIAEVAAEEDDAGRRVGREIARPGRREAIGRQADHHAARDAALGVHGAERWGRPWYLSTWRRGIGGRGKAWASGSRHSTSHTRLCGTSSDDGRRGALWWCTSS